MLLRRVWVTGLRSIDKAEMDSCGHFNVLIGKNNSGKSNLLSAVLGFFNTLKSGEIVDLRPMFNTEDDYYDRNSKRPIEITCTFDIAADEMAKIVESMSIEFPPIGSTTTNNNIAQVRGARFLRATTKHFLRPRPFGILTKVGLSDVDDISHKDTYITIFEIADDLAPQILERFQQASQKRSELRGYGRLQRSFDADDFSTLSANSSHVLR